jgi:hypothetical protein
MMRLLKRLLSAVREMVRDRAKDLTRNNYIMAAAALAPV